MLYAHLVHPMPVQRRQNGALNSIAFASLLIFSSGVYDLSRAVAQCNPHWVYDIGQPGVNDRVFALRVFDDQLGGGPALYVGGFFTTAGGAPANRIAKWNGSSWSTLGTGMNEAVITLLEYDDGQGGGPALYAGGNFFIAGGQPAGRVAKWNGTTWSPVGSGVNGTVGCLCAFDDGLGGGTALYAGGNFSSADGAPGTSRIAKWNGSGWSSVGGGADGEVTSMVVFDDGSGTALWVGGYFNSIGGQPVGHIAKWDGVTWTPAGVLGAQPFEHVHALGIFDDGNGPRLHAGGYFETADNQAVKHVARWNGTNWEPMANGLFGEVVAFTVFDERTGDGPALFASGFFIGGSGTTANNIARWDGAAWSILDTGLNDQTWAVTTFDDGSGRGPALYAGGFSTTAGGQPSSRVAHWTGSGIPALTLQPGDQQVFAGQSVVLNAAAIGEIPLSYQWRKDVAPLSDGGNISGALTATLTIDPAAGVESGSYDVVVSNTCGTVFSAAAAVVVSVPGCPGDTNVDGYVNALDINGFISCVLNGTDCDQTDLDDDGETADIDTADDTDAFAVRLVSPITFCP